MRLAALGATTFSGPNFFNLEASLAKSVRFTERFTLDLRLEAGVTNTPQFLSTTNGGTAGGTTLGSTSFGRLTSALVSRPALAEYECACPSRTDGLTVVEQEDCA